MAKGDKHIKQASLPQNIGSRAIENRFLESLQDSDEIPRSEKKLEKGFLVIVKDELEFDGLKYFVKNKKRLQKEYFERLNQILPRGKAKLFCNIISKEWYRDSRNKRVKKNLKGLLVSIRNYLKEYKKGSQSEIQVLDSLTSGIKPNFTPEEIKEIIALNSRLIRTYIEDWISIRPNSEELSMSDIYLRRGIVLTKSLGKQYKEKNYINSYSLSFSVPENFARLNKKKDKRKGHKKNKRAVIFNISYDEIEDRILFFSPLIFGMTPKQVEFGLIPHYYALTIKRQNKSGGITEYLIENPTG